MEKADRPWGYFIVIGDFPDCKIKRLVVYPGKRLSLQSHQHRKEDWITLHGSGEAVVGKETLKLEKGTRIEIPIQTIHRLINCHPSENLEVIEIQTGSYFGEDDIVRYHDDFGRMVN